MRYLDLLYVTYVYRHGRVDVSHSEFSTSLFMFLLSVTYDPLSANDSSSFSMMVLSLIKKATTASHCEVVNCFITAVEILSLTYLPTYLISPLWGVIGTVRQLRLRGCDCSTCPYTSHVLISNVLLRLCRSSRLVVTDVRDRLGSQ